MTIPAASGHAYPVPVAAPGLRAFQNVLVWLVGASVAIVFIEPSPYEIATLAATAVFFTTTPRLPAVFLPLIALLVILNLGYSICAIPLLDQTNVAIWIGTSWYMAVTAVLIALMTAENTAERLAALRRGLIAGAVLSSILGIAGYLHLVPGGYDLLTLYGRARGTFKDPNVFGAFLILPALFLMQSVVTDPPARAFRSTVLLGIVALAILLAFSRAAWGGLAITATFMLVLMLITSRSSKERSRIIITAALAVLLVLVLLGILLSFDYTAEMFKQRASFGQSYDSGRFGRFGRHILGADMALDLPLGIGPIQFHRYFPEDTHNSFLNAFMSGGWLSGVCYPALVFTTVIVGFRHIRVPVPWQREYLAIFAAFTGTVGESFIIDTDHWRHYFMMLGAMWGMFAAARYYRATTPPLRAGATMHPPFARPNYSGT